ncbi:hypothetical protein [Sphaerisporangium aureirubrum]|uniref:Uncharacterized protein n=1 Tax=Sphaerisporangium aureirubrum TaxID=1544736 RepID=A0ABW1NVY8_9ACTN
MRKGTTALSAGALTLALSGGVALLVTAPAYASAPRVAGCDRGGGPLSVLGGGPCDLTGPAGGPVGDLVGGGLDPITDTLDDLAEDANHVLDDLGDTAENVLGGKPSHPPESHGNRSPRSEEDRGKPSDPPGAGSRGTPTPETYAEQEADPVADDEADAPPSEDDLLGLPVGSGCLPPAVPGDCEEVTVTPAPSRPAGRDRSTPTPSPTPRPSSAGGGEASPPAGPEATPAPGFHGTGGHGGDMERANPVDPSPPAADIDAPPLAPLWPGQPLPELTEPLAARPVVPSRSDDAVGTVLTAVLLGSAILAARIVHTRQARRGDTDPAPTMPLQGLHRPPDAGRHRLA